MASAPSGDRRRIGTYVTCDDGDDNDDADADDNDLPPVDDLLDDDDDVADDVDDDFPHEQDDNVDDDDDAEAFGVFLQRAFEKFKKKGRLKGAGKGRSKGANSSGTPPAGADAAGMRRPSLVKKTGRCMDCMQPGHRHGDPECPMVREGKVARFHGTHHAAADMEETGHFRLRRCR